MRPEIRFVHSSDWHLEAPLAGLPSLSDDLRALARDAAYLAAEKVIETTLVEGADALLLSGDIVDLARSGPRAIVFLREQFERLNARNVEVYWAGGVTDGPDEWPMVAKLPENVHRFGTSRFEQIDQKRDGKVIARIQGLSSQDCGRVDTTGFHRDANGVFTVGVAYSTSDSPGREGDRVDYMALGGRHRRATVDNEPGIAHFCGSPQGRTPAESGPSGCTLVHVVDGKTQTKFISTDIIRWVDESIEVTASTTIEQLEERMDERLDKLRQKSQGTDLLVSFHVRGTGPLVTLLRPCHETDALIARLQKRASKRSPLCWTLGLGCLSAPTVPEEWYDQETILGDFLRQLAEYEEDPRKSLELDTLLPAPLSNEVLKSVAKFKNQDHRTRVIENSKKLGIELLTSPEAAMQLG